LKLIVCGQAREGEEGRLHCWQASIYLRAQGLKEGSPPAPLQDLLQGLSALVSFTEKQRNWQGRGGGDAEESPTIKAILDHRCFLELSFCMTVLNYLPNSCSISIAWTLGI
jgi:hypothetical protein